MMDLFDDLSCDFTDIFGETSTMMSSSVGMLDYPYDSDLHQSPSRSSDSGVVDVIPVDCNDFLPTFNNSNDLIVENMGCRKSSSTLSTASSTFTDLDHPYSKSLSSSDLSERGEENDVISENVVLNRPLLKRARNLHNVLPLKHKREAPVVHHVSKDKFEYLDENGQVITVDKSRKNAEMAKLNRQRKKRYVANLEAEMKSLRTRNTKLAASKSISEKKIEVLENEVDYLRSVLHNKTILSSLVKSISNIPEVEINFDQDESFYSSAKRPKFIERLPGKRMPSADSFGTEYDGGICLHVSKNKVAIELCAECNKKS